MRRVEAGKQLIELHKLASLVGGQDAKNRKFSRLSHKNGTTREKNDEAMKILLQARNFIFSIFMEKFFFPPNIKRSSHRFTLSIFHIFTTMRSLTRTIL